MNISKNYNSTTSGKYTLHVSNESTEMSLDYKQLSSANNFKVVLNPSLDLNQLSYLQSLDCEMALENLQIDSCPLVFQSNESIETFFHILPDICRDNLELFPETQDKRNNEPLTTAVGEYFTNNVTNAIEYINDIIHKGSNYFIITRYAELFLDNAYLIKKEIFNDLNIYSEIPITVDDIDLLTKYVKIGLYVRLNLVEKLNSYINPGRPMTALFPEEMLQFEKVDFNQAKETETLAASDFLNSHLEQTTKRNEDLRVISVPADTSALPTGITVDPWVLINFNLFYGVDFSSKPSSSDDRLNETTEERSARQVNERKLQLISNDISDNAARKVEFELEITLGEGDELEPKNYRYIEQTISNNIKIINIGKKLLQLLGFEVQRLNNREKYKIFSRNFLSLDLDRSQQKCLFYIDYNKLAEHCTLTVNFPPIVSYKLGSNRNQSSGDYNKVQVGPIANISILPDPENRISNTITHVSQRLSGSFRLLPKLLCVATDILSESARQQEKQQFFFLKDDMTTFFKTSLQNKYRDLSFLTIEAADLKTQPFFRIHKNHFIINNFVIMLFDENGQFLQFPRNTIINLALSFRPCLL